MSSKRGDRRPLSLAVRLTLWYAAAAFLLVVVATGFLYLGLVETLDREDDEFLIEKARAVMRVLQSQPGKLDALQQEVTAGGGDKEAGRVFARVILASGESVETPGLSSWLPRQSFPQRVRNETVRSIEGAGLDRRPVRLRVHWTDQGDTVHIAMDRSGDREVLEHFRRRLSYILGLSLIAAVAGGYWIARRGLRPIAEVTETVRRIRPTHLTERVEASGRPTEVRELAETFNLMLDRLESAFSRLGRFAADIAHELRTPLNNLRTEVDVSLGRARSTEEYQATLASCLEECDQLTRLVDSLLFLARAEDPRQELVTETVNIAAELRTVHDFYEPSALEAGVALELDVQNDLPIRASRTLIHQAIGNLVANALAHTPRGGRVTLFGEQSGGEVRFGVRDTGVGIPADQIPLVFERFFRGATSRRDSGGMGLGLAIVKAIADLHRGHISASSSPGQETVFTLTIPRGGA